MGGESPLLVASRAGNAALVKALIAKGAQVNATEPVRGQTALMWAVANRRDEVARVLIQAGADVHARSIVTPREYQTGSRYVAYDDVRFVVKVEEGGFTPLLFAARSGDAASADLLLAAGAKVDDPAPTGATPLVLAAHSGNRDVAALLLDRGADPNAAGAGYTALHAAVLRGDVRAGGSAARARREGRRAARARHAGPALQPGLRVQRRSHRRDAVLAGRAVRRCADHARAGRGARRHAGDRAPTDRMRCWPPWRRRPGSDPAIGGTGI